MTFGQPSRTKIAATTPAAVISIARSWKNALSSILPDSRWRRQTPLQRIGRYHPRIRVKVAL